MTNLEKSFTVISKILKFLVEVGLQQVDLTPETIELEADLRPFFSSAFSWLHHEGIVRCANQIEDLNGDGGLIISPQITARGLMLLGQDIEFQGKKQTVQNAIIEANDNRSWSQIGDFIGGLLGGFTKSLGS